MTEPTSANEQPKHPERYTFSAELVANIYRLMGQVPAAQGGRVYVQLENEIGRQNQQFSKDNNDGAVAKVIKRIKND